MRISPWTWGEFWVVCVFTSVIGFVVGRMWILVFHETTPGALLGVGAVVGSAILVVRELLHRGGRR